MTTTLDVESVRLLVQLDKVPSNEKEQTLIRWLIGKDPGRSALSMKVLAGSGRDAVSLLLQEATAPGKNSDTRIKLLQAIERIGMPLEPGQWFDLQFLARRFGRDVQAQAARVLKLHARRHPPGQPASPMA